MNILELLGGGQAKEIIENISKQAGTTQQETSSVVNAAGPLLMGMLKNNASSEQGAAGILGALSKHDGSVFDNLGAFFGNNEASSADGLGILGHILGGKQNEVQTAISKETGVSIGSIAKILPLLAPLIMGYLGMQSKNKKVNTGGGLGDLLGGMLGGNAGGAGGLLGQILGGGSSKGGGLGGLLGGLGDMLGGKK